MLHEKANVRGDVSIVLKDSEGNIKDQREIRNLVVNVGLNLILSRLKDTSKGVMTHMAVGTNNTTPSATQTDLQAIAGSREVLDSTTVVDNTITYVASFEAGKGTGALVEAGIFNNSTGGDMLCRTIFPVVNKGADDVMAITWTITLSAV
jgi:hypothetical protein